MKFAIKKRTVGSRDNLLIHWEEHLQYLRALSRSQELVTAGAYDDGSGGLLIVQAPSREAAEAIAQRDPLVQAEIDEYELLGWLPTDGDTLEDQRVSRQLLFNLPATPLQAPPSEENFRVVDGTEEANRAQFMLTCFASERAAQRSPLRLAYLRRAKGRGLRKLLLLHEEELVGQIEFAPPGTSGLPLEGEDLAVIHCLWVIDAYTGLGGGCRLLAACADEAQSASLATVAFNNSLPWLPRSFFEQQGFKVVDSAETGRFFQNQPITAYLLWRPLQSGATPPSWDKTKLLEGVDFCPAYPWLYGKRLYWGQSFDFHGMLVKEGLRRTEILQQLPRLGTQRTGKWTIIKFGLPAADLERALELVQMSLLAEPTYYAHIYGQNQLLIVYPDRIFRLSKDPATWGEAIRYGTDKGIPSDELSFQPNEFADESF